MKSFSLKVIGESKKDRIVLHEEYAKGLIGLEKHREIVVLYWDELGRRIGVTVVKFIRIEGNEIFTEIGEGLQIIDIKPHFDDLGV